MADVLTWVLYSHIIYFVLGAGVTSYILSVSLLVINGHSFRIYILSNVLMDDNIDMTE